MNQPTTHLATGKTGEALAKQYLIAHGCQVLAQNYKTRFGEIDLVIRDKHALAFCEVKTRRSLTFGRPEEALTPRKQAKLVRLAHAYLAVERVHAAIFRFDVVAILLREDQPPDITWIRDAFRP